MGATWRTADSTPSRASAWSTGRSPQHVLAVMSTAGLYNHRHVDVSRGHARQERRRRRHRRPVQPGAFAVATFSPPLDKPGNSVRGQRAIEMIADELHAGVFNVPKGKSEHERGRNHRRANGSRASCAPRGASQQPRRVGMHRKRKAPATILEKQATTRVPELVPIRYGRMLASPFTFYRGAAGDHGRRPRARRRSTGLQRAALRRRPPLELRRASPRRTGGSSSTSTTSTRPCRARSSGT